MSEARDSNVEPFARAAREGGQGVRSAVERYDGRLRRYFLRIMTPADAADAVQEVYTRLLMASRQDPDREFAAAYVFRTADSVARDARRRRQVREGDAHTELPEEIGSEDPSPFDDVRWREQARQLQAVVNTLPPRERRVLLMHRVDGLSLVEIARRTGRPLRSVQRNLANALATCRARLETAGWFER